MILSPALNYDVSIVVGCIQKGGGGEQGFQINRYVIVDMAALEKDTM